MTERVLLLLDMGLSAHTASWIPNSDLPALVVLTNLIPLDNCNQYPETV